MTFNPEFGGERQFVPETEDEKKWQGLGGAARRLLLLEQSDNWPPSPEKRHASIRDKRVARFSSEIAGMGMDVRPRR